MARAVVALSSGKRCAIISERCYTPEKAFVNNFAKNATTPWWCSLAADTPESLSRTQ